MNFRCANCGSKKISIIDKNDTYDIKKGAIGVALLGASGAIMGINGKSTKYYHCNECGSTLAYKMPEKIASNIDKYLNAPAVYKDLLNMEKKIYSNIEWEQSDEEKEKFSSNIELGKAINEYMLNTNTSVLSEKQINKLFGIIDKYGKVNAYDAYDLYTGELHLYIDEIDDEKQLYYIIPEYLINNVLESIIEKIKIGRSIKKSEVDIIIYNNILNEYSSYIQEEQFIKKLEEEIYRKVSNKDEIMPYPYDLYGYINGDYDIILYSKEVRENSIECNQIAKEKRELMVNTLLKNTTEKKLELNTLIDLLTDWLINNEITNNKEKAKQIIILFLKLENRKNILIEYGTDNDNPTILILNAEEKEKIKKELKDELEKRRKEREDNVKENEKKRDELNKKRKEEEIKEKERKMEYIYPYYYSEIERLLEEEQGLTVAELYKRSNLLKEYSKNSLDPLMELMKYLVKIEMCNSFKIIIDDSSVGPIYFYINDENLNLELLKEKRKNEYMNIHNRFNNKNSINKNENSIGTKEGCYVATCVYGSYDCPQVWTLRRYRDNNLGKTWYGRLFIKIYYAISPKIVKLFGKTKWFKKICQGKLDKIVNKLQSEGYESTPYQDINWR